MPFADLSVSRRLEHAEGRAGADFAEARRLSSPDSGAEWIEVAGAYAVFDGVDSPVTQTFGLGVFEELRAPTLDVIEHFFRDRRAPVMHEVSPFAGVSALDLLSKRGYRPIELSTVLYRTVEKPAHDGYTNIAVRVIGSEEASLWAQVSARGWSHDHPELLDFLLNFGVIASSRTNSVCFLSEIDGVPGSAGVLCIDNGVALFGGAATVPELRNRGLQAALLEARMRYAFENGCDLAMMVTEVGSKSQRNAERKGFHIAYTRTKWQLFDAADQAP